MQHRRRLGPETVKPLLGVVLVEDGDRLDAGLLEPLELEGKRHRPMGEPLDAAGETLRQAAVVNELILALADERSRSFAGIFALDARRLGDPGRPERPRRSDAETLEQTPELRRLERSHAHRAETTD